MIRTAIIVFAVAFLGLVTLAGIARPKPRPVDALDQWRADHDARKAGL